MSKLSIVADDGLANFVRINIFQAVLGGKDVVMNEIGVWDFGELLVDGGASLWGIVIEDGDFVAEGGGGGGKAKGDTRGAAAGGVEVGNHMEDFHGFISVE